MKGPKLELKASCEDCEYVKLEVEEDVPYCSHETSPHNDTLSRSNETPDWCPLLEAATQKFGASFIPNPFLLQIEVRKSAADEPAVSELVKSPCVLEGGSFHQLVLGYRFPSEYESTQAGKRVVAAFPAAQYKVRRA